MNSQEKVGQEQIHDLLFKESLSWQSIIYDLINTQQLDPWDIDLVLLSSRYLEKIKEMEEANFFISSKVLLAASLLLRMKSDILLNYDIPSLDDILFGKKEEKVYVQERIELDEDLPELVPRTPLPRLRKVTLPELMAALGKAIKTENRRITKEIVSRQHIKEFELAIPKGAFNLGDKIKTVNDQIEEIFKIRDSKLAFSEFLKLSSEDNKIYSFVSLLHLDNQQKIWLEQESHFEEIWILVKRLYIEQNKEKLEKLKEEMNALNDGHESKLEEDWSMYVADEDDETEERQRFETGFGSEIEKEIDE